MALGGLAPSRGNVGRGEQVVRPLEGQLRLYSSSTQMMPRTQDLSQCGSCHERASASQPLLTYFLLWLNCTNHFFFLFLFFHFFKFFQDTSILQYIFSKTLNNLFPNRYKVQLYCQNIHSSEAKLIFSFLALQKVNLSILPSHIQQQWFYFSF